MEQNLQEGGFFHPLIILLLWSTVEKHTRAQAVQTPGTRCHGSFLGGSRMRSALSFVSRRQQWRKN